MIDARDDLYGKRRSYSTVMAKKLACLQIASVLHAASVCRRSSPRRVFEGHDSSSVFERYNRFIRSSSGDHGLCSFAAKALPAKVPCFIAICQTDSIRHTIYTLSVRCICWHRGKGRLSTDRAGEQSRRAKRAAAGYSASITPAAARSKRWPERWCY